MFKSRISSLALLAAVCAMSVAAAGCSTLASAPSDSQVALIKDACAADKLARPTVDVLTAVTGLATPDEALALKGARAIIDPICANPAASPQANALAIVTGASDQIAGIVATLEARRASTSPPASSSSSSPSSSASSAASSSS